MTCHLVFVEQSSTNDRLNIIEDHLNGRVISRVEIWSVYWPSDCVIQLLGIGKSKRLWRAW